MEEGKTPSKFIPTKKMIYAFLAIFVIGAFFNASHFPLAKFMSMGALEEGVSFGVGWPNVFMSLDLLNATTTPLNFLNLFLDLLFLFGLAYAIDVFLNFFFELDFVKDIISKVFDKEKNPRSEKPKLIA